MIPNPCCCVCETICLDAFTRANSSDPNSGSPCGWTVITGSWSIAGNTLQTSSDNARITSGVTVPDDFLFEVVLSPSTVNMRDETILFLDENKIVFSRGATTHELHHITWMPDGGTPITAVSPCANYGGGFTDNGTHAIRAIKDGSTLYIQVTGSTTGVKNIFKIEGFGTVAAVGLGTGHVETGPTTFDNFSVKTPPASCTTWDDPDTCWIFADSFGGSNETSLGAQWATQAGTLTFTNYFGNHYLTLTDATIETQQFRYTHATEEIEQVQFQLSSSWSGSASTITTSFGGISIVLHWYTANCTCLIVDGTIYRIGMGGSPLFIYDVASGILKCGGTICKTLGPFSLPDTLSITATGTAKIDAVTLRAVTGTSPDSSDDCPPATAISCPACYEVSFAPCDTSVTNTCNVDFTGTWSVSGGKFVTTDGSADFLPNESWPDSTGMESFVIGAIFQDADDSLTITFAGCSKTIVCGSTNPNNYVPHPNPGTIDGNPFVGTQLEPGTSITVQMVVAHGWCVMKAWVDNYYWLVGFSTKAAAFDQHVSIATSGTVTIDNLIPADGDDTSLGYMGTLINEGEGWCTPDDFELPTICGTADVTSLQVTIDYDYAVFGSPAQCAACSGTVVCEVVWVKSSVITSPRVDVFIGQATICDLPCEVVVYKDGSNVTCTIEGLTAVSPPDFYYLSKITFSGVSCGTSQTKTGQIIWCEPGKQSRGDVEILVEIP